MTMEADSLQPVHRTATFVRRDDRIIAHFGLTLENNLNEVWTALTRPEKLVDWLAPGEIDPRPGGAVKLNFVDSGVVIDSLITNFDSWRVLEFSWSAPGEPERPVRFELEPVGAAVGLGLTLSVPEGEDAGRGAAGWAAHLDMLAAALADAPIAFPLDVFRTAREDFRGRVADL